MSGTRFARAARCRFFVYVSILVLMMGMLIIFHNSQLQLDEARQQRLLCEQQQETLNDRLSSLVEQKFQLEKKREQELGEQLEVKRNLGQRIKELEETMQSEKLQSQVRYEKLEQSKQQLESKHENWVTDCSKAKVEQLQNTNALEKQLHNLQSELRKGKSVESSEINLWKEKFNIIKHENQNLNEQLKNRTLEINNIKLVVKEYQNHCAYHPLLNTNKAVNTSISIAEGEEVIKKSFQEQETVTDGVYRVNISEKLTKNINVEQHLSSINESTTQESDQLNQSSSVSSIGNIQIPKSGGFGNNQSAEQKQSETGKISLLSTVSVQNRSIYQKSLGGLSITGHNSTALGANSDSMRLVLPAKKLPENVAPIPENFEKLLDKSKSETVLNPYDAELQPVKDQAPSEFDYKTKKMQKSLASAQILNGEKFANDGHNDGGLLEDGQNLQDGLDDGNHPLLDVNNLHNEVAADQGKEFGDNLRLDEADVDDGGDDDDYSNPSARKQEDQAVRN